MKILFMGTPDFAVPSLEALLAAGHTIAGAITQPDRPVGRGMKLTPPPVKACALAHGIPVYQPTKLKDGALLPLLRELAPDAIAVVAYGRLLPKYILDFPKYGCVNVHGSLLPRWRGAAPIQWAVLSGDAVSGVCTMRMDEGLDTGDVIERAEVSIGADETAEALFERLALLGARKLVSTMALLESGAATFTPQQGEATYARMLTREDGVIDWTAPARTVRNTIRGCYSWPIATTDCAAGRMKLYAAAAGEATNAAPGTVISIDARGMQVACGDGESVCITLLQFPNAKRMAPADYFRGHPSILGEVLGKSGGTI